MMTFLESQVREAIAILENGTDYEKMHVPSILRAGLESLDSPGDREPRYDIIFPDGHRFSAIKNPLKTGVLTHKGLTRDQVLKKRRVSGDIVVYTDTIEIVLDDWWLFDWERQSVKCYARAAMEFQKSLNWDKSHRINRR